MKVGYKRVSTLDQNTDRQLDGVVLDKVFEDKASGKDTNRQSLLECLRFVREGDILFVHSLDRLARSLADLNSLVKEVVGKGVELRFVKEGLTFTNQSSNPTADLMLNVLGAIAQFERELIRQRQAEGIAKAKEKGVYTGRKRVLTAKEIDVLLTKRVMGIPISRIAQDLGVSRSTIYNYLKT